MQIHGHFLLSEWRIWFDTENFILYTIQSQSTTIDHLAQSMASTDQLRQRRVAPNASIESGIPIKILKIKKRSVVNDADLIFYVFAIGTSAAGRFQSFPTI